MVTDGMRGATMESKEKRTSRQNRLVQYFVDTLHMHNVYAAGYFICEALNFINAVSILAVIGAHTFMMLKFRPQN